MRRKNNDRHLGPPSEANRDKHINFLALENQDLDLSRDLAEERKATRKNTKHPIAVKSNRKNRGR